MNPNMQRILLAAAVLFCCLSRALVADELQDVLSERQGKVKTINNVVFTPKGGWSVDDIIPSGVAQQTGHGFGGTAVV